MAAELAVHLSVAAVCLLYGVHFDLRWNLERLVSRYTYWALVMQVVYLTARWSRRGTSGDGLPALYAVSLQNCAVVAVGSFWIYMSHAWLDDTLLDKEYRRRAELEFLASRDFDYSWADAITSDLICHAIPAINMLMFSVGCATPRELREASRRSMVAWYSVTPAAVYSLLVVGPVQVVREYRLLPVWVGMLTWAASALFLYAWLVPHALCDGFAGRLYRLHRPRKA